MIFGVKGRGGIIDRRQDYHDLDVSLVDFTMGNGVEEINDTIVNQLLLAFIHLIFSLIGSNVICLPNMT